VSEFRRIAGCAQPAENQGKQSVKARCGCVALWAFPAFAYDQATEPGDIKAEWRDVCAEADGQQARCMVEQRRSASGHDPGAGRLFASSSPKESLSAGRGCAKLSPQPSHAFHCFRLPISDDISLTTEAPKVVTHFSAVLRRR
jgi:hypothetical protein